MVLSTLFSQLSGKNRSYAFIRKVCQSVKQLLHKNMVNRAKMCILKKMIVVDGLFMEQHTFVFAKIVCVIATHVLLMHAWVFFLTREDPG
jgi:hypothetical protein